MRVVVVIYYLLLLLHLLVLNVNFALSLFDEKTARCISLLSLFSQEFLLNVAVLPLSNTVHLLIHTYNTPASTYPILFNISVDASVSVYFSSRFRLFCINTVESGYSDTIYFLIQANFRVWSLLY